MAGFLKRLFSRKEKALGEGGWRGPFTALGELGHSFALNCLEDGWQRNLFHTTRSAEQFGPVYTCVTILSQELSRIPVIHYKYRENGSRVEIKNKAPYRIFRKPNNYQTKSDFIVYLMRSLLLDGNAYAMATRNDRYEVDALYPISPSMVNPYMREGEVFYSVSTDDTVPFSDRTWVPQRDMLHIRMHCPRHPLMGESPIKAALVPAVTGMEINAHTANFFHNMSRPSGILRHPGVLSADAMERIKLKFKDVMSRQNTGDPIVLQEGMEWTTLTMNAVDAELVGSYKLTERQIAQVFRIPPFLLGDLEKATFQNVESLSRFFVQSSLGWYVDHFEDAFTSFFGLPNDEQMIFDIETALLRSDLKERMEAYAKGIQNGVFAPNEARARESLPPVEDGDAPRVQQQLVPLSFGMNMQPPAAGQPSAPAEPEEPDNPEEPEEPEPTEEQQLAAAIIARRAIEKAMVS